MRRNDPLSLGIEINEREIRLVQVGTKGGRSSVVHASAHPIPPGAMMGGVVLEPGTLVVALRRALDGLGAPTSAAVAVSGEQSSFRTVVVPPCPDAELPALVGSEIEHQGMLGPNDAYGYFPIYPTDAADTMRSLMVVGVDEAVTQSLTEAMEGVGIAVEAMEPTPLATLRTAVLGLPADASAFVLVVGSSSTDAAFFADGRLAALRRIDVGMDAIACPFAMMPSSYEDRDEDGREDGFAPGAFGTGGFGEGGFGTRLDGDAVDRLALEAQRTVDYFQRASRGEVVIERIRIAGDDAQTAPLAAMLERRLGLIVEVASPPAAPGEIPDGRFSAAYGLAVRETAAGLATPTVDLFTAKRTAARRVETKRYFMGSVLVAALSVAVGLGGCLLYNGQIAASRARCANVLAETAKARGVAQAALEAHAAEDLRAKTLRKEGVPLGALMDVVAGGLDSGVGLKLVTVTDDLKVHLQGEARDETSLVRTAQALKTSPVLLDVAVEKFDRDDRSPHGVIKFELSGGTVSADRIAEAPQG